MDAINAADVEVLIALCHEDAVNHLVANEPVEGKAAIKEKFVNDKIIFQRGYGDKLSFLKQHNLPIE